MSEIILPSEMSASEKAITAPYLDAQETKYEKGNPIALQKLCEDCALILQHEFNGNGEFAWGLKPTVDGSMIDIKLFAEGLHGKYGMSLYTSDLQQVTGRRKALTDAAGELLERYNLDGKRSPHDSKLKRDTRGEVIPEL